MARMLLTAMLFCLPASAIAADSFRVIQLEQELRFLQQQVQQQSQEIAQLRMQLAGRPPESAPVATPPASPTLPPLRPAPSPVANPSAPWLDASRWQRVRAGMSELDVINALGPPTSMRANEDERVLFYAMEIGNSGFLSGSVTLRDRTVTQVQVPVLK